MKKTSAILAIFLLGMILTPCSDTVGADQCGQEIHLHDQGEHDGHSDLDLCSPFCTCSCCGSFYMAKTKFYSNHEYSAFQLKNTQYFNSSYKEYTSIVFQPPKA
ncbi:MAG: hypothetical protein NWS46_01545 [Cyclobacteriaceae bacterium]|nr:hypothetical protein [Cyclobacteriaceae bacterium]